MKQALLALFIGLSTYSYSNAQTLPLPHALKQAIAHFPHIKSKQAQWQAAQQQASLSRLNRLPEFHLAAQQTYGTINAQNGPLYAQGGLGVASTSMPLADQNWNAAFGSLYLANINWTVFAFGRIDHQVAMAEESARVQQLDLEQEVFQHQIKVGAQYLNLLASQRIQWIQERNLSRAAIFLQTTASRAQSGLVPEVDHSLAQAEVSHATSAKIKAYDQVLEQSKNLAFYLGVDFQEFELDSVYSHRSPGFDSSQNGIKTHPSLAWQQHKIAHSQVAEKWSKSQAWPSLSVFGVLQGRGSGFDWNYVQDPTAYSQNYSKAVGIDRSNYIAGFTLSWNLSDVYRNKRQNQVQKFKTTALEHEYELTVQKLKAEEQMWQAKLTNALVQLEETQVQLDAANLAYKQHTALYQNGLTTVVEFTQALYILNRAEMEREIAQNNSWQALLYLAAVSGNIDLFINAIP